MIIRLNRPEQLNGNRGNIVIDENIIKQHGLTEKEYKQILDILGRAPNLVELGIFSVMWSEHCSYKSSKKYLKTLYTTGKQVICGPGENAGVVDIGDGQAAIFKMESHNHPSFIEPFQGAATGVGGILRDIFTMGARPIANLNALRFGEADHPKTNYLINGVVEGIASYGNCVGVPTVAGETSFDASYNGNILVNAMTVGLADTDNIFYSAASGIGNPVIYVGAKTGRDGIHGATMASCEFNEDNEEKRPTVQVGDPFVEKLLIEACLELMQTDTIIAIQDMGAAGLTCSSFEMASKGGTGIELNLDNVPQREDGMTPYEMMLSESQERMLMVLKPGKEHIAQAIFEKWDLDFAIVGKITDTKKMIATFNNEVVVELPIDPLAEASPEYSRSFTEPVPLSKINESKPANRPIDTLCKMIESGELASRSWIWRQYDHMVQTNNAVLPGGDAAVIRVNDNNKGIAVTTDCSPHYCYADPKMGSIQAVTETWRNLIASGARPLAITNCLNFGNPEKPEVMGQFVKSIEGIKEACEFFDFPVVSGNVSLYNETNGVPIKPTPQIGAIGIIDDIDTVLTISQQKNDFLYLIGTNKCELGQSVYSRVIEQNFDGKMPEVDLEEEKANGELILSLAKNKLITACHDVSAGGIMATLAEMALASNLGMSLTLRDQSTGFLFGESQGMYVVAVSANKQTEFLKTVGDRAVLLGITQSGHFAIGYKPSQTISLIKLRKVFEGWFNRFSQ